MEGKNAFDTYVSFETAKLMAEKGFDKPTIAYTYGEGMVNYYSSPKVTDAGSIEAGRYPLPTIDQAISWLFDQPHSLGISIEYSPNGFFCKIRTILRDSKGYVIGSKEVEGPTDFYGTYNDAYDAAIKFCLEK